MTGPGHPVALNSIAQEESVTMSLATGIEERASATGLFCVRAGQSKWIEDPV